MLEGNLIKRCREKESRAQQELYDLYKSRLMGLCRRYARSRDDAQDILQEAFFRIFTKIDQLEEESKLEGWIIRTTIHTAINHYRASLKFKDQVDILQHDFVGSGDEILAALSDEVILGVINTLPDSARMVFNMHVIEGYSHVEISEMLGISQSTSRSQFHYAKSLVKKKLKKINLVKYA